MKRELVEFKRAVVPLQRPLEAIVAGRLPEVPKEIRRYFRDVNDHLTRTVEQVQSYDELLNSILQARLAQVTVEQNNDMRKIAAWAGIAAVWTAVAGIYGMNFALHARSCSGGTGTRACGRCACSPRSCCTGSSAASGWL